jgi:hypothetical protein
MKVVTYICALLLAASSAHSAVPSTREETVARFIALCEQSEVVFVAQATKKPGVVEFSCVDVLKAKEERPSVGDKVEFRSNLHRSQERVLVFVSKFPSKSGFQSWPVRDDKVFADVTIEELRTALVAKKG